MKEKSKSFKIKIKNKKKRNHLDEGQVSHYYLKYNHRNHSPDILLCEPSKQIKR